MSNTLSRRDAFLLCMLTLIWGLNWPVMKIGVADYPAFTKPDWSLRLMAAMALITDPEVVILDEPTTALDVTTQVEVLRAFRRVVRERQVTAVYVSHDLAVVAQMADHILVLRGGQMQELHLTAAADPRSAEAVAVSLAVRVSVTVQEVPTGMVRSTARVPPSAPRVKSSLPGPIGRTPQSTVNPNCAPSAGSPSPSGSTARRSV